MIILTENRKIRVKLTNYEVEEDYLIFKNKYGVVRLRVKRDKIVAYGYGLDNDNSPVQILE